MLGAAQAQQIFTGLDWISDKCVLFPSDTACDDELLSLRGTNADFNILIIFTHPSKHNYPENKQIQELSVGYQYSRHPEGHGRCCLTMAQYFFLVLIHPLFSPFIYKSNISLLSNCCLPRTVLLLLKRIWNEFSTGIALSKKLISMCIGKGH